MISVLSAMQFMHEWWRESLTPRSKTPHSLTVVMLTYSQRHVTWRRVLPIRELTNSIIIEWTPTRVGTTTLNWIWSMLPHPDLSWSDEIRICVLLVVGAGLCQRAITELNWYLQPWTKLDWTRRAVLDYYFWWMCLGTLRKLELVPNVLS